MNTQDSFNDQNNDSIDIVKELRYYLFFWPWFSLSVLVFALGAYLYLRYADTIYQTSATLQVKDSSADPTSFLTEGTGAMFDLGKVKLDNYIAQISSKPNLSELVDRLDLQTQVFGLGRVKNSLQFGAEIPFQIVFKNENTYTEGIKLSIAPSKANVEIGTVETPFDPTQAFETDDFVLIANPDQNHLFQKLGLDQRGSPLRHIEFLPWRILSGALYLPEKYFHF